jgi:long-chain acyl-CoA synthetase
MKRLFDCLDHQLDHFPKKDMLAAKEKGVWKTYSTADVASTVDALSAGLISLGVSGHNFTPESSDKIAIMSSNRPEWVFTDLACQQIGAILVPLYPTTNPIEVEFILNDAAVGYVFVSNLELYEKVKSVASKVPSIKGIYTLML